MAEQPMLSPEELYLLKINPDVAREAYAQAERRFADVLDVKKAFEQKAFTLFGAYITLALALGGVGATIFKDHGGVTNQVWALLLVAAMFVVGAILFVIALLDDSYGSFGSDPGQWLRRGVIDGGDNTVPYMLAYRTHAYRHRIQKSVESNASKAHLIRIGVFLGVLSPPVLVVAILWL